MLQITTAAGAIDTTSGEINVPYDHRAIEFCFDLTAAATDVTDTLDVSIQAFVGGQWVDVVHFTQVLGNGGAKRYFAKINATAAVTMFENATALAAGSVRDLVSTRYRVRYVQVDANSNAAFTFTVKATPLW